MAHRGTYSFTFLATLTTVFLVVGVAVALVVVGYNTSTSVGTRALKDRFGLLYEGASTYLQETVRAIGIAQRTMIAQRGLDSTLIAAPDVADDVDPAFADVDGAAESAGALQREPYRSLVSFSNEFPVLSAVYFGYGDGSFAYYADLRRWSARRRAAISTPEEAVHTVWQIVGSATGPPVAWRAFYDAEGTRIASRAIEEEEYDPRERPWYRTAIAAPTTILTEPYVFASTPQLGLTLATKFARASVVAGADMVLDDVARFAGGLRLGPSSLVVVFTRDGWAIGHDGEAEVRGATGGTRLARMSALHVPESDNRILKGLMRLGLDANANSASIDEAGRAYLLAAAPIRVDIGRALAGEADTAERDDALFLGVATPIDEMNAELRRSMAVFAGIGIGGLLLGAVMAVISARALARPISYLGGQARRLADLDFTPEATPIGSRVSEVRDLADALERARAALRVFATYVPRQLVERLIRNPSQAGLGGERRNISIMFTDVAGYGAIAEKLAAERLMAVTSSYFDRIGQVIEANDGIIDKFVGDSVMAIWNAPDLNPSHVDACCRAALALASSLREFNREAEARGAPAFPTRIGIHCGECVVGNVGSTDRISYTAIGSEVNLASRVEGLNGLYGTSVLASRAVAEAAQGRFLFRWIDRVVPVGMSEAIDVYELLEEEEAIASARSDDGSMVPHLEAWDEAVARYRAGDYGMAARAFGHVLAEVPGDVPARLLAERCAAFAENGPPAGWRGEFHAPMKRD